MVYLLKTSNFRSTEHYYYILQSAFSKTFGKVEVVDSLNIFKLHKNNDCYIIGAAKPALLLLINGCKNVIYWCQGVGPEERKIYKEPSYMMLLHSMIEKYILKKAKMIFFVSEAMKKHFEKKYRLDFHNRYYIMPCFNEDHLDEECFNNDGKYQNNIFAYSGNLLPWQCFEKTAEIYHRIEQKSTVPTKFLVLTYEVEKAKNILFDKNVKNFEVKYVTPELVGRELRNVKYGFVIRENNIVNNVATPTKLSGYLAEGVIPIITESIIDFCSITKDYKYLIRLKEIDIEKNCEQILEHTRQKIDGIDVKKEYEEIFKKYYNTKYHISCIAEIIKNIFD